ncbi:hypothetical protein [Flagellimonas sp. S3867]|uniref:hypothetical protein n=1 Tax=Flagellimonas sp. S3867 TaxID=2768063 RepID=UPI0016841A7B|nr:hypothetical protein [Flagellimonas sp. S3867]
MRVYYIVPLIVFLLLACCDNSNTKDKLSQTEEIHVGYQKEILNENDGDMKKALLEYDKNVKTNLVLCDNFEFTIRVDRLMDHSLRYACWKKPKSAYDVPDFIINNGVIFENTLDDRKEYTFSNTDWNYSIERIISLDAPEVVHIFLEIHNKNGKENYAWKMRDLSHSRYAESK